MKTQVNFIGRLRITVRILVVGGAGFLGSEVVTALSKVKSNEIYILDNYMHGYPAKLPKKRNIKDFIVANIKDYSSVSSALEKSKPEVVVHLASHITRPEAVGEFRNCASVNHVGTANLLDCCLKSGKTVKKIVYASSESVRNIRSHHGISTLAAERLLESICPFAGIQLSVLRFSEIYGISKSYSSLSLLNFLVDNMINNQSIALFDVNKRKDYLHISDAVIACELAVTSDIDKAINIDIGSSAVFKSKELVEILKTMVKYEGQLKYLQHPGIYSVESLANTDLAKKLLGFESKSDFDTQLKALVTKRRKDLK